MKPLDFAQVQTVYVTADDDGIRLDRWFKRHVPDLSFGQLSKMLRKGEVRLSGKRVEAKTRIVKGQKIRIPPLDNRLRDPAQALAPRVASDADRHAVADMVLHEDDAVLILNKPPGLPTQGGSGQTRHLDGLLKSMPGPSPRLVHRLDKDTSGVLVLGKTARAAAALAAAFKARETEKLYHALVIGQPPGKEGRVNAPLAKLPGKAGERMVVSDEGKGAVTDYRVIDRAGDRCSLCALRPVTGRTHQLRVHMAHLNCPIVGDGKYGGKEAFLPGIISRKLHLHARRIGLAHPDGGMLTIAAPYPPHMAETIAALGLDADEEADTPWPAGRS